MLRLDLADVLPFDRLKGLATAAHAAATLRQFTDLRRLYPSDVDPSEAANLHELLCWFLETALAGEEWAKARNIKWEAIPFDPPAVPVWLAGVPGAA